MKQFFTEITANKKIAEGYFELNFRWPEDIESPKPGQFFTLRASDGEAPLLRRPFAFSAFEKGTASVIYQKRGPATTILSTRKAGETADIAAPFGNHFLPQPGKLNIVIAGGIGLGPIQFLARKLQDSGEKVRFLFGCRDSRLIPETESFKVLDPQICTDDGSRGFKGTTVDLLKTFSKEELKQSVLHACGPYPMLKACRQLAETFEITCYVSLEEYMACGVGACMGCVTAMETGGYARVCKEGPIFNSKDVVWH